jgi:hypothetical protein
MGTTQIPVQNLNLGMQLLSFDMTSQKFVRTTVTRFFSVVTYNQMVVKTSTGRPLIVDQNPAPESLRALPGWNADAYVSD